MPIFHGFGLGVCIHTPLYIGMKCILIPQFKAKEFAKLIKKYRPAFLAGVPTMYEALINSRPMKKKYLSSVTTVISGGDILTPVLKKSLNEYLANHGSDAQVRVGYGLTECTAASCLTPRFYYKEGSIGLPFPDTEYKIVKIGTTSEVKVNHDGEICINGPTVMKGYLDEKEETANTLKKHADGKIWLHTGDVGYINHRGIVFFKSRIKRIIVSSGYNIYPQYIEKVLNMHPAVETSIVVGLEHPYKVQVPKAYIVLKTGFTLDEKLKKEIKAYCERFIAKYSLPYEYEYRDTLPKTLVGKVAFNKLEDK
jgi:long-chain acyl-CoA synthetase